MTAYFDLIKKILSAAERLSPTTACSRQDKSRSLGNDNVH